MYRTPYRRAFKATDGTRMIELLNGTEITYEEWSTNIEKYRIVETRQYDDIDGWVDVAPEETP